MTPTHELRFVERTITDGLNDDGLLRYKTIRILQQKWENPYVGESEEWRDVEVVKEK